MLFIQFLQGLHNLTGSLLESYKLETTNNNSKSPEKPTRYDKCNFFRCSGSENVCPQIENHICKLLSVTPINDVSYPIILFAQASGPRLFQDDEIKKYIHSLKNPWICLIVLRYASNVPTDEEFSYPSNSTIRILYNSTKGFLSHDRNKHSFDELLVLWNTLNPDNLAAPQTLNARTKSSTTSETKELNKEIQQRGIAFVRLNGCHVVPELPQWISAHLKENIANSVEGNPTLVLVQTSGPIVFQEEELTEKINEIRKRSPWVCMVVLRYSPKEIEPEEFSKFTCDGWVRFLYKGDAEIYHCMQNENSWAKLLNLYEQFKKK